MRDISAIEILGSASYIAVAYTLDCVWSLVILTLWRLCQCASVSVFIQL